MYSLPIKLSATGENTPRANTALASRIIPVLPLIFTVYMPWLVGSKYIRRDGLSDFILERAIKQYGKSVTKEDVFYYVYGVLHSKIYRHLFANDLKKMLPRIPLVDKPKDFWAFSKAGRKLAELKSIIFQKKLINMWLMENQQ